MTLAREATLISKAVAILAKLKVIPRRIYEMKTDSILIDTGVQAKATNTGRYSRDYLRGAGG